MFFHARLALRELWFRKAKTILTIVGIGLLVAMTALAISFSDTLLTERAKLLNPLDKLGLDLVVVKKGTKSLDFGAPEKVMSYDNLAAGDKFTEDNLSAKAMPEITAEEISNIARPAGVAAITRVLLVTNDRLEGTVPEDVEIPEYRGQPLSPEERQQIAAALETNLTYQDLTKQIMELVSLPPESRTATDSNSIAAMETQRSTIEQSLWPERLKSIPRREVKVKEIPVEGKKWSLASVDPTEPKHGLVTPKDIIKGKFPTTEDQKTIIASADFAAKEDLTVGGALILKGEKYRVIGIARSRLGGGSADLYLTFDELRRISGADGPNLLMVKARTRQDADKLETRIKKTLPGSIVTGDSKLRSQIGGTLVSAAATASRATLLLTGLIFLASVVFLTLIGLTTLVSRAPEIGALKAIGWGSPRLIWQFFLETLAQTIAGVALGALIIAAVGRFAGPLAKVELSVLTPRLGLAGLSGAESGALRAATRLIPVESQLDWVVIGKIAITALIIVLLSALFVGGRLASLKPTAALKRLD